MDIQPKSPTIRTTQDVSRSSISRIFALDFVRGVAILLAMGWHFNGSRTDWIPVDVLLIPGRTIGWAGVDLFFVLSGFLVGGLIFAEVKKSGTFVANRFLVRRAFKIWPIMYCYIALLLLSGRYTAEQILPQTLFHVQNYFLTPLNHLWSLAVEEHFYLIFALVLTTIRGNSDRVSKWAPKVLGATMVVTLMLRLLGQTFGAEEHDLQVQTHYRLDALACGVLLAYLKSFKPEQFSQLKARKSVWMLVTILGYVALAYVTSKPAILATVGYTLSYVTGASFLLLVLDSRTVTGRNLIARGVAWIGTYSYAMYVFQFVGFRAFESLWKRYATAPLPAIADVCVKYVGAVLLAVVVTKIVERPLLRVREALFPAH